MNDRKIEVKVRREFEVPRIEEHEELPVITAGSLDLN